MRFDMDFTFDAGGARKRLAITSDAPLVALVGPSGIGKTTALDCIAGLRDPVSGHIAIAGRRLDGLPPQSRRAGYVFQDVRLFPHLTVAANLAFSGTSPDHAMLERLGIAPLLGRYPANLSGGEARRVAFARALASDPAFLLLDEPLASIDAGRAARIEGLIAESAALGQLPILLVSHSTAEIARLQAETVTLHDA